MIYSNQIKMELLETTAQSLEIETIISESMDFTIIVSPYLKINNRLKPKIADCFKRNNSNLIIYRENELTKDEKKWLDSFSNITLIPIKNLHAKCYLNEKKALITSMNLYDYSQINNHEIGIKFSAKTNKQEFENLLGLIKNIVKTDHPYFDFTHFYELQIEYTMGSLYAELIKEYNFPQNYDVLDSVYILMCQIAKDVVKFQKADWKEDGSALKRITKLDAGVYLILKKAISEKGKSKK